MIFRILCLVSLSVILISSCVPQPAAQDSLVLINGPLIDGTGSNPIPDAALLIQADKIIAAGPKKNIKIPTGARVIDVAGATILPGFINAHVHFGFDEQKLRSWAQGGVTTVRDEAIISSGDIGTLKDRLAFRDKNNQNPELARIISAGFMVSVPGGYGQLLVNSAADARQKILAEIDAGVDLVKISMEDGYAGRSGLPKLTTEEIKEIIDAAHERHSLVSGHVTQAQYLQTLIEAGVDDIAHVPYDLVPDEAWQVMVTKGISLTPTFSVYRNYGAPVQVCVENLKKFVSFGGLVALGNDYGGGPGNFELGIPMYELEKMAESGMTPMQIIIASTKNAAYVSHIEDKLGTLEAGKLADILVVSGNPLEDLQALQNIKLVIHNGIIIRQDN